MSRSTCVKVPTFINCHPWVVPPPPVRPHPDTPACVLQRRWNPANRHWEHRAGGEVRARWQPVCEAPGSVSPALSPRPAHLRTESGSRSTARHGPAPDGSPPGEMLTRRSLHKLSLPHITRESSFTLRLVLQMLARAVFPCRCKKAAERILQSTPARLRLVRQSHRLRVSVWVWSVSRSVPAAAAAAAAAAATAAGWQDTDREEDRLTGPHSSA